jgi:GTPase SAR1 family protein
MEKEKPKNSYLVKIIVIGDSGVGKTNLITRFC